MLSDDVGLLASKRNRPFQHMAASSKTKALFCKHTSYVGRLDSPRHCRHAWSQRSEQGSATSGSYEHGTVASLRGATWISKASENCAAAEPWVPRRRLGPRARALGSRSCRFPALHQSAARHPCLQQSEQPALHLNSRSVMTSPTISYLLT